MNVPILESERLICKPLSLSHSSQEYVDWLNNPAVFKYLETGGNNTLKMLEDFITQIEKKEMKIARV